MIPNIDSKPTMKPFKDVSGIFVTVNFDGNYLTWVKIPEVFDKWNAYCFDNNSLSYFRYDTLVTDPHKRKHESRILSTNLTKKK